MFGKVTSKEKEIKEFAQELQAGEIRKRSWCIEQAVMLDDASPVNLPTIAEKIYEYVYGARE